MSADTYLTTRYRTGEKCPRKGIWRFDSYVDGTSSPPPTAEESEIPLEREEVFPPIRSAKKACYWRYSRIQ